MSQVFPQSPETLQREVLSKSARAGKRFSQFAGFLSFCALISWAAEGERERERERENESVRCIRREKKFVQRARPRGVSGARARANRTVFAGVVFLWIYYNSACRSVRHWEEMEGNDITTLPLLHGEGVFEGTSHVFVVFFPSLVLSPQGRDLREWGRWTRGRERERERAHEESSIVGRSLSVFLLSHWLEGQSCSLNPVWRLWLVGCGCFFKYRHFYEPGVDFY